jgi:PAS domain S-box-containing protein
MVDIERLAASGRRDAILDAVAFAAEQLLLASDWRVAAPDALARLGTANDVSRAYILENHFDEQGRLCTTQVAEWCAPGVAPQTGIPDLTASPWEDGFSRWVDLHAHNLPVIAAVRDLPEGERQSIAAQGIASLIELPVFVGGQWWGCVGFDDCLAERDWSGAEHDSLRSFAGVLGAALLRQRADEQRAQAESRLRQLYERIPAVTYTDVMVNGAIQVGYMSPQVEAVLGYPPERFQQDPRFWESLIHPEDQARLDGMGAFAATDLSTFDHEYRMLTADGRTIWVHDISTTMFDEAGNVDYFLGFMTDITEAKRVQEGLGQAEKRYRMLVEHTPAITYQEPHGEGPYDPESVINYVSPQVEAILGYDADEWSAPGFWYSRMHADDRERVIQEADRTLASEEPYSQDYRLIARDGRVVWFRDEAILIRDADGIPQFWQGVLIDITDQKAVESQLRSAQERYRALVEHIPAVVYAEAIVASTDDFYISPRVQEMFGYSPQEWGASDHFWSERLHPDDRDRVMAVNDDTNRTGATYREQYRLRAADGRYLWIQDEAERVVDEDGTPLFWQGVFVDITQQKEAEQRLREAESRYRALVEHIPAAVYLQAPDADPFEFYISPQVEAMFGYTAHEWAFDDDFWEHRIHPDDHDRVMEADAATDADRAPFAHEYRFRKADGSWCWVHDEAVFVPTDDGRGFWQGFILDITDRRASEEQLREAELKFRTIVEQNQAIFYTQEIDPNDPSVSRTTYVAPGSTNMFGYSLDDVTRDPTLWRAVTHPDDRDRVFAADAQSNQDGDGHFSLEYRMIAKDGQVVWVQDEARLVTLPGKAPYWQGFLLDITERKEGEAQLERALSVEREATQRLRALDEMKNTFLQAVSHDLRTPLAAILGLAITLERGDVHLTEDDARDLASRIAGNARRLDRLVMNLLDLDRLARGIVEPKLEQIDVGGLVRRLLAESDLIPQERLVTDIEPVVIPIDAAKLERIVENLVANTIRHTPSDATVWISVHPSTDPEGVLIAVEDDGTGVAPGLRETIFEPFQQGPDAPQHSPGVGVGLTLVRRFAELHDGRAWVQEREGGGASFRVFLPAHPGGGPLAEAPDP